MRVLVAILFFPRGGSAGVAGAFVDGLRDAGVTVTLLAGSRSDLDGHGDARAFYGPNVVPVSFDAALASPDPLAYAVPPAAVGTAPIHPSYEKRAGAVDRVFAALDDAQFEVQISAWAAALKAAGAAEADVLHLHHLTPIHEAARRVAPGVPVVTHLHGTELLMLEQIEAGPPAGWTHAAAWAERLRGWAADSEALLVSPGGRERAGALLGIDLDAMIELPNGVDTDRFRRREVDRAETWRRVLDGREIEDGPVLTYVGRFTAVKRLPQLIESFCAARRLAGGRGSLVIIGGHPGEWEGEHPRTTIERLGAEHVYLAGWHAHDELPELLSAADAIVTAARREQFGQLLVEGMACELAAVAPAELGPATIIDDGVTGWLTDPEDPDALAGALAAVLRDPDEARRRGVQGRRVVRARYSRAAADAALLDALCAAAGLRNGEPAAGAV
jgi:glycosyltransferase involved in cell wall biosynthesis